MAIEIVRGTNPTIEIKFSEPVLVPVYEEQRGEETVTLKSYVTIRREVCETSEINPAEGELQMEMEEDGTVTDDLGNRFILQSDSVLITLSRDYTKGMQCGPYFLQFNLIDNEGDLFTVDTKPIPVMVRPNLADL